MIIQELKSLLESSVNPIARVLYKKENFRVLAIGFKKNMILKDHKTPYESKLLIIEGKVIYKEQLKELTLLQFEEVMIPINEIHNVTALQDSVCLLIQS
jgi:quercetin dioxygenase-like cupin family protein